MDGFVTDIDGKKYNTNGWSDSKIKSFEDKKAKGQPWMSDTKWNSQFDKPNQSKVVMK